MKKMICSLALLLALGAKGEAQELDLNTLNGKWLGPDGAGLEIVDSSKLFLVYQGDKKEVLNYKADCTKTPCWFDFTVRSGGDSFEVKSLLLQLDEDLLQWQIFEENRPGDFQVDRGQMVYLRKRD